MGRRKQSAPRRGSLAFRPRKRAERLVPRIRSWPIVNFPKPRLLGFLAYKVGMTHALMIDDRPNRPTSGKEVAIPITILEAAPVIPVAIRAYKLVPGYGYLTLTEAWINTPEELEIWRKVKTLKVENTGTRLKQLQNLINQIARISVIIATQPKLVGGLSKKKPDLLEVVIGGGSSIQDQLDYAIKILGKSLHVKEVFEEGQFVDVIGVTKGKGFQGVIKRFGVKELPRWHKHRKGSRRIGARSPGIGTLSEVPQAGQMGFHRRTEYNKRILKISDNGLEITPAGGFPHYGIVRSTYIMLHGSVQGPPKRPVVLRHPIRPPTWTPPGPPTITYISLESKISG